MVSGNPGLSRGWAGVPSAYCQWPLWRGHMFNMEVSNSMPPTVGYFWTQRTKKQWWHLSWAIMISPYNENVTYCSMTLCGPPQDDESWGPYVLPKKKKQAFYKEGKTWNLLIKSQPVDRHSFWSSTVLCAMGKCEPRRAWHKQPTHLHNLVEWHKRQTQTTDVGKRGWDAHPFVVTYLICTHARANKTSYEARNSSKLLWLQCAHVTRTHLSLLSWK